MPGKRKPWRSLGWQANKERVEWTPEMLRGLKYCRRTLRLPLKETADYIGVDLRTLQRKMEKLKMPRKLKNYAARAVRDRFRPQDEA